MSNSTMLSPLRASVSLVKRQQVQQHEEESKEALLSPYHLHSSQVTPTPSNRSLLFLSPDTPQQQQANKQRERQCQLYTKDIPMHPLNRQQQSQQQEEDNQTACSGNTNTGSSHPLSSHTVASFIGDKLLSETASELSAITQQLSQHESSLLAQQTRLEPKVIVPFSHPHTHHAGADHSIHHTHHHPPRRIAIERKKKLYATQSLSALLLEANINYTLFSPQQDHTTGLPCFLPLELFDDTEYEMYTEQEWLTLGRDVTGRVSIQGQALRMDSDGHGDYYACHIHDYDVQAQRWCIRFIDAPQMIIKIHRLFLYFAMENPQTYVARVIHAHQVRREYESRLRYSLYVDSMPIDELNHMDAEQINRILFLTLNTKKLKLSHLDTSMLVNELHLDYSRAINQIIFNHTYKPKQQQNMLATTRTTSTSTDSTTMTSYSRRPSHGCVPVPAHDFAQHFSDFCFHSFLAKSEAITALIKVNHECLKISTLPFFLTHYHKSVRMEEFEQTQLNSIHLFSHYLHEKLLHNVTHVLKTTLRDCEKGWLNLYEKNREIYELSKLKKLMLTINFMMVDQIRTTVEQACQQYSHMIIQACAYQVEIQSIQQVVVTHTQATATTATATATTAASATTGTSTESTDGQHDLPLPLFSLDLLFKDSIIQYSVSPIQLASIPCSVFDAAFQSLQKLPQIENFCLPQLFHQNNMSYLASLQREESGLQHLYEAMQSALQTAIQPAYQWATLFEPYIPFLTANVDEELKELLSKYPIQSFDSSTQSSSSFFNSNTSPLSSSAASSSSLLEILQQQITQQIAYKSTLESAIPRSIHLGLIHINHEDIRRKLMNKCQDNITKYLECLCKITRMKCEFLTSYVKRIELDMKRIPLDIYDWMKCKEFLQTIPQIVLFIKNVIFYDIIQYFEVLENTFHYRIHKDLYKIKYTVYGYPKFLMDLMQLRELQLSNDQYVFLMEMKTAQEELIIEINELDKKINYLSHLHDFEPLDKLNEKVEHLYSAVQQCVLRAQTYNTQEALFGITPTDYRHVLALEKNLYHYYLLFTTAYHWSKSQHAYHYGSFLELNADDMQTQVGTYVKNITKLLSVKVMKESSNHYHLLNTLKKELEHFRTLLPMIVALRNPGMKDRHWVLLNKNLPFALHIDESMNLHRILEEYQIIQYSEYIIKISDFAAKEYQIEITLNRMEECWKNKEFAIVPYKSTGTYCVKSVDDIIALVDEHMVTTQAMQFSPYKKTFEDRIQKWSHKLNLVSEVIEEWLSVQKQWINLYSIFLSSDMNKQLPAESKKFAMVNKNYRLIMSQVHANPEVLSFADNITLLNKLQDYHYILLSIQKKLADYLDQKRVQFPRFYFLANEELLAILSQTTDPLAVQPHLRKCFENIEKLEFDREAAWILAMQSAEGEVVRLEGKECVSVVGRNVEHWLSDVEASMKHSLQRVMNASIADYVTQPRRQWVQTWPGQTVLNASQYHWTMDVEQALQQNGAKGLHMYQEQWQKQLDDMVELVRCPLTPLQSLTMGALIVLDVHARDVLERLVKEQVSQVTDFAWQCQMRYYRQDEALFVQMVSARLPYGYEYLGNTLRLVITPLTDRCYLTLMSAISLHLGGSPTGPAGTGKTETVKDLAKCVAKQCVVFNCSDGLNVSAMGKFFKGLASAGAWACFDEFNRIDIEVLSVVAQQIMTIWSAVREQASHFVFEGVDIRLDPTVSVFITMNPGYAGRTELPDNLECLFRPVAMMVPDYALIAEIMLYSFGFHEAQKLARKMVATFKLCSEQLSAQDHYDYGMRAVKTVITRAGILKQASPADNEESLLLRSLRDVNVPKFLKQDLPLFDGIISDLFPTLASAETSADQQDTQSLLKQSIQTVCSTMGLQAVPPFVEKCIQLFDTIVVRHGVMLVGPSGGGKTSNLRTLAASLSRLAPQHPKTFNKVNVFTLNPKSITQDQLYGGVDKHSLEWQDGILAGIIRECIADHTPTKKWVVFDGPVDAVWIENMNTVLDDNKKLCLVSGEILTLTPAMTMLFEVEDLSVASPATVSRCGMVFMDAAVLGTAPLLASWLQARSAVFQEHHAAFMTVFDHYVTQALLFVRKECTEPVPTCDNNLIKSFLNILECLLLPYLPIEESSTEGRGVSSRTGTPATNRQKEIGDETSSEGQPSFEAVLSHLDALCVLSVIWSIGGALDEPSRVKFSSFLRMLSNHPNNPDVLPVDGSVYDYTYSLSNTRWQPWLDPTTSVYRFDDRLSYNEIIIPTKDSVRNTYMLELLVTQHKHVLFTGNTGTGKTVNIQQYFARLPAELVPINIIFSAATSANQLDDMLMTKMQKRRQRVFGPPLGKQYLIFIDDLNMPAREKYGAQPPIELLRQYMDHHGWYDRKTLSFTEIVDVSLVAAMAPPGGGRNVITARFLRHFNQIAHTEMSQQTLFSIYSLIVEHGLLKFPEEIRSMAHTLVNATIHVYTTIISSLLPTPAKSHYTFNLRDLSAVFQGMLSASHRKVISVPSFLRLWTHENRRVFKDRLINDQDRHWCDELFNTTLNKYFALNWLDIAPVDGDNNNSNGLLLFGDYLDGHSAEQKQYEEVVDVAQAKRIMEETLLDYNDEYSPPMKLTLFYDCIDHISRIARILRQPGGNALLLGVGGSGRQSLTRLACFLCEYTLKTIEITKNYGTNEWHEDMKSLLFDAGLKEQNTVFLITDTQLTIESFYHDINNLLNSYEIPHLYSSEEMDTIFVTCKIDCQRKNIPATKTNAYHQFVLRVKANLHLVLCMSPASPQFRTRLRMYPALVNCCTIDWFNDWPEQALISVAETSFTAVEGGGSAGVESELQLNFEDKSKIVSMMGSMHQSVSEKSKLYHEELRRYNYVTPTSYLELLSIFKFLLREKRQDIGGLRQKLQNGLNKLEAASQDVAQLQLDLTEKQPRLVETQKEVAATMLEIESDRMDAASTKEQVEQQSIEAELKAAECKSMRDAAQTELDKALPMLDKAVECLAELNKTHIDEVRNFKKPPTAVVLTMEAACIMLKNVLKLKVTMKAAADPSKPKIPDYWDTAQKFLLKQPKLLLETLKGYDKENIPEEILMKIKPYIEREDFAVKNVEKASVACRAICMWVHAMYQFSLVNAQVEPLRVRLIEAEAELDAVMIRLNDAKQRMEQVEARLWSLEAKYNSGVEESESLQYSVEQCQIKLQRAEKLISGLGGERERWMSSVASLSVSYDNIIGDVLIAAGTIAYLGAFTADYRVQLIDHWRSMLSSLDVSHSEITSITKILGDPVQIRAWNIAGLPTDTVSIENGIIMSKARRWPLMIDPQGQAAKFIKKLGSQKFPEEGMEVLKLSDKHFLTTFENACRFGKWVLLENVLEELDPALEGVLLQQIVNMKGIPHIKIGENMIPYNDQFHLYITTKLPNPHYAPELQVKVTLLNFTITPNGLTDQMLGTVVAREQPELESKKNALVIQNARMKKQLADTEDAILRMLNEATGDILEDEGLIDTLATSKKTSAEINERVKEAELIEKEIDAARGVYLCVAERASILYFCIAELAMIDPMYQYSLSWFVNLFIAAIAAAPSGVTIIAATTATTSTSTSTPRTTNTTNTPRSNNEVEQKQKEEKTAVDVSVRLTNLNDYFTYSLYTNVSRSLFQHHKLLFSFLLTMKVLQGSNSINALEWKFFVAGGSSKRIVANPGKGWLTDESWSAVLALTELDTYKGFDEVFTQTLPLFQRYCESNDPYTHTLPEPYQSSLSVFQRLLMLRCLRPDKISEALAMFVSTCMGSRFTESPPFSIHQTYRDSSNICPIIFILSRGADPTSKLLQYAGDQGHRDKLTCISLGQGQGPIAEKYIADAMKRGGWTILQNCHLALSWLPTLEKILNNTRSDEIHPDFRLWITSMPSASFPVSILQNGVKVTNEPPKGLRANLQRAYMNLTDTQLNSTSKPYAYKKLLYALNFFHAVLLERKRYGAQGFNIPYYFNETDLSVCQQQMAEFIDMYPEIPYQVMHFLTYDVNYGGRVTDDIDRRIVATILEDFINPEVMRDDYAFSESGKYTSLPVMSTCEGYIHRINEYSQAAAPEVLGMHSNADIVSAQEEAMNMLNTILTIFPRTTHNPTTGEVSRDHMIQDTVHTLLNHLPAAFDLNSISTAYPTDYTESMNTVLIQECIRYNRLLATITSTLQDVQKAMLGVLGLTEDLENMMNQLYLNVIPDLWLKVSYPSLMSLSAYVTDLSARMKFLQQWVLEGIPRVYWISGFFFPQAFLTGSLQNYARKYSISIDSLLFEYLVTDYVLEADVAAAGVHSSTDGIYVSGLSLQGARWDKEQHSLADSKNKELFVSFPVLRLVPTQTHTQKKEEHRAGEETKTDGEYYVYKCPVYKTLTRAGTLSTTGHSTNFVMFVDIPTKVHPKKWIKAGVALFCALRY